MRLGVAVVFADAHHSGRTRDVSESGAFVEAKTAAEPGDAVEMHLLDGETGQMVQLEGEVVRRLEGTANSIGGVGIRFVDPPDAWLVLVGRLRDAQGPDRKAARRQRILVVADEERRRGALALYVTSGWDVRFASDVAGVIEALRGLPVDAAIVEMDLNDARWVPILEATRRAQPDARRLVRTHIPKGQTPPPGGRDDLVHRVVDLAAGLEALLDALSADWGAQASR